jgi:integrase
MEEIRATGSHVPDHITAAVLLGAGTGLRQGEIFGLTVDRVDFLRKELRVDRQLFTPGRGPAVLAPPKSKRSYRTIGLGQVVTDGLAAHLGRFGKDGGRYGLVFHQPSGIPVNRAQASQYFAQAATRAGLAGRTWHDLRHHHASLLLSEGVSPALVAERLGHDLATLLKTYAHVIRADEDRVRAITDTALTLSTEDQVRTKAE